MWGKSKPQKPRKPSKLDMVLQLHGLTERQRKAIERGDAKITDTGKLIVFHLPAPKPDDAA
jgi:hypothetical protein